MTSGWNPQKVATVKRAFGQFTDHVIIKSKERGRYRLSDGLYNAQERLLSGVFDGLGADIHDFKCLKSRQLGLSTISEALAIFWWGMFSGVQAAVILDTASHLKEARMRVKDVITTLPKSFGYPGIVEDSRELMTFENGSAVRWLAAGVRETESSGNLGRGSGLNMVWASEVSSWKNEEGLISLQETLSESFENRLYIWESTARGFNAWRDMWIEAKADDLHQKAIFVGWWAHPLHNVSKDDRRYARYGTPIVTPQEAEIITTVKSDYGHEITQEQLAWLRWKRDPNKDTEDGEKKGGQFRQQEQPSTESECFTVSGSSFFDHVSLNQQTKRLITFEAPKRYRYLFGAEFPETIITPAIQHRETQLRIWNPPVNGVQYIVSADTAFGRNPDNDRSACQVVACYADCLEQVAEFADPLTNTDQFAWVVASLAAWYGLQGQVEVFFEIDGPGEAAWKAYEKIPRMVRSPYLRSMASDRGLLDVFANVRQYMFQRPDAMGGRPSAWQWKTGNRKETIMERLKVVTNNGAMIVKSMETIEEMRKIARDGAAIEAPSHKHDDRVLALAFAVRAWDDSVRDKLMAKGVTKAAHEESLKMTSPARYNIFMQNTISNMFRQKQALQKQEARTARMDAYRRGRR